MSQQIDTIIFDLDGTLVDSLPDIAKAANTALVHFGRPPLSQDTIRGFIGNGLPHLSTLVEQEAGLENAHGFVDILLSAYAENPYASTMLYPGVETTLKRFQQSGIAMGVCSNKTEALCIKVIEGLGLAQYFNVILGGDTLPQRKPAAEPLLYCAQRLDGTAPLYVGDSEVDEATALAAGMPFGFFTEGYAHKAIKTDAFRFSHFSELETHVLTPAI
ncbi:MAG: phosphoglycolate phosphatase [Litoreibacter sp.]